MTGKELKIRIKNLGFDLAEIARLLNISPQSLNSKLNADDIKLSIIESIAKSINKNVYDLIGEVYDNSLSLENEKLRVEVASLKQQLKDKEKMISLLEDQNETLKSLAEERSKKISDIHLNIKQSEPEPPAKEQSNKRIEKGSQHKGLQS